MRVILNPRHAEHVPPHEVDNGTPVPPWELPGRLAAIRAALASLGRRRPSSVDTNFDPSVNPGTITYGVVDGTGQGPIKSPQITVPFYASWPSPTGAQGRLNPDYQQIAEIMSRANSIVIPGGKDGKSIAVYRDSRTKTCHALPCGKYVLKIPGSDPEGKERDGQKIIRGPDEIPFAGREVSFTVEKGSPPVIDLGEIQLEPLPR